MYYITRRGKKFCFKGVFNCDAFKKSVFLLHFLMVNYVLKVKKKVCSDSV